MTDSAQFFLIIVVVALTALLIVVGFEVFLVFKEFKKTIEKVNKILDNTGLISESIAKSMFSISSSLGSLLGVTNLLGLVLMRRKKKKEEDEKDG